MRLANNVEPRMLLDEAGLDCNHGNVQTQAPVHPDRNKLGGVEFPWHSCQGTRQRSLDRSFLRGPKARSGAGAVDPHEVPAHLANHGVENRRRDLFHQRPVFANRLRERIHAFRQGALPAQENGVRLHARALFDTMGAFWLLEPVTCSVGATAARDDECSATKSRTKPDGFALIGSGSEPEKPVASGWLSGWTK